MIQKLELVVLVADTDAEWTLRTLLEKRYQALGIRQIKFDKKQADLLRDPGRDAGTYLNAPTILRPYLNKAQRAIVMLDREGTGREFNMSAAEMESDIEGRLHAVGWNDAVSIVLDPELEVWVWSRSSHVRRVLNLTENQFQNILEKYPRTENGKPQRPKEAMLDALKLGNRPHSPRIFQELAENVSLNRSERAFDRLKQTLLLWFV